MSIAPFIIFGIIFGIIIWGYFSYSTFTQYFPIHILIKIIILIIALCSMFAPQLIDKFKEGKNMDEVKEFMIKKYGKK